MKKPITTVAILSVLASFTFMASAHQSSGIQTQVSPSISENLEFGTAFDEHYRGVKKPKVKLQIQGTPRRVISEKVYNEIKKSWGGNVDDSDQLLPETSLD